MNGDLISREALIKELEQRHLDDVFIKRGLPPVYKMSLECNRALKTQGSAIRAVINGLPAVDAEPVRHGKWIYDPDANDWGIGGYVCSECHAKNENLPCGKVANPMMFVGTKYCPYCGAKMDLEDEQ